MTHNQTDTGTSPETHLACGLRKSSGLRVTNGGVDMDYEQMNLLEIMALIDEAGREEWTALDFWRKVNVARLVRNGQIMVESN